MDQKEKKGSTIWIWNDTRIRMNGLRRRGVSVDRFLNDLMDAVYPQEREEKLEVEIEGEVEVGYENS